MFFRVHFSLFSISFFFTFRCMYSRWKISHLKSNRAIADLQSTIIFDIVRYIHWTFFHENYIHFLRSVPRSIVVHRHTSMWCMLYAQTEKSLNKRAQSLLLSLSCIRLFVVLVSSIYFRIVCHQYLSDAGTFTINIQFVCRRDKWEAARGRHGTNIHLKQKKCSFHLSLTLNRSFSSHLGRWFDTKKIPKKHQTSDQLDSTIPFYSIDTHIIYLSYFNSILVHYTTQKSIIYNILGAVENTFRNHGLLLSWFFFFPVGLNTHSFEFCDEKSSHVRQVIGYSILFIVITSVLEMKKVLIDEIVNWIKYLVEKVYFERRTQN